MICRCQEVVIDAVVSGVDESVCGVSSVMTAGELDVCDCDSVVSDEASNSSRVEVVVSINDDVARGDEPLLHDAVRIGGQLSVDGYTLTCGAGVAGVTEETMGFWLEHEWFNLVGLTGSSAQTVPCDPIHHRCMQCV